MADTREVVIKLVVSGNGEKENGGRSGDNISENGQTNLSEILHPIKTAESALKKSFPKTALTFNYAFNVTKSGLLYAINRNYNLREDYMSEVALNNTFSLINKISSAGSAIAAGALVGGIPGAVIGGVGWLGNEIMSAYQKYDQQQIGLNEMNYQSTFQRTRMGLIDGGRGTEN